MLAARTVSFLLGQLPGTILRARLRRIFRRDQPQFHILPRQVLLAFRQARQDSSVWISVPPERHESRQLSCRSCFKKRSTDYPDVRYASVLSLSCEQRVPTGVIDKTGAYRTSA